MSSTEILRPPDNGDGPTPDVMNDPQYATNTENGMDNGDPDTCRICRGEALDGEPLFYPCKCSGSIKFVHQDCLMEWLSHSQKKHCELCKTPFRFTKLYSPNMPQSLPTRVFLRHFAIHVVKNLATYMRFVLVVSVWFLALPYATRLFWRALFWFSDGGWPNRRFAMELMRNNSATRALEMAQQVDVANLASNGTSPVSPLFAAQTSPASMGTLMERLVGFLMPVSQTLNISGSDPLMTGFFRTLYYSFKLTTTALSDGLTNSTNQTFSNTSTLRRPSLLSGVSFLRDLTPSPTFNSLFIEISEGYIITILVVICFILVFLIREWVVQQQPGINMGAAFNADAAAGDAHRDPPQEEQNAPNRPERHAPRQPRIRELIEDERQANVIRRRNNILNLRPRIEEENNALGVPQHQHDAGQPAPNIDTLFYRRPDTLLPDEEPSSPSHSPSPDPDVQMTEEFSAIWRRAGGDPKKILEIMEKEGLRDRMQYWADAMNARLRTEAEDHPSQVLARYNFASSSRPSAPAQLDNDRNFTNRAENSTSDSDSWEELPRSLESRKENTSSMNGESSRSYRQISSNGKGPLTSIPGNAEGRSTNEWAISEDDELESTSSEVGDLSLQNSNESQPSTSSFQRPRAISDVPHYRENKSPLGHGNWTFSNLPDEDFSDQNINWLRENKRLNDADVVLLARKAAEELDLHHGVNSDNGVGPSQSQTTSSIRDIQNQQTDHDGTLDTIGQDEITLMDSDWVEDSPITDEEDEEQDEPEENPFAPDTTLPPPRDPLIPPPRPVEQQGILGQMADWFWAGPDGAGRREDLGANDEHVIEDLAAEAPFVPIVPANRDVVVGGGGGGGGDAEQDREVLEAAIAAGLDPNDADVEEPEDFDGIMELVGMRGPIFGLVQNAIFSILLLTFTVALGIGVPYNIGRVSLLLLANPGPTFKLPLRFIFGFAAFVQDTVLVGIGLLSYCFFALAKMSLSFLNQMYPAAVFEVGNNALKVSQSAFDRVMNGPIESFLRIAYSDVSTSTFSAASHEALLTIKSCISNVFVSIGNTLVFLISGKYQLFPAGIGGFAVNLWETLVNTSAELSIILSRPESWVISLEVPKRGVPLNLELSSWGGLDRMWAIFVGYATISLLGALYVRRGIPFRSKPGLVRDIEATMIDIFNQAGGVMKVILIISIEMLVFPLYCGLLLDLALLPLFENATIMSRLSFTARSPATSIFVHWFVGTCYMFHFALFVSMCRKIMRKGVLYFIRDPDDPTFHPVRDVLERNVATQLRKILFSALVYGALVIVCLGGVVWGLAFALKGVLPIHWSSNEPVLEFPVDLLFYNFLMPLAIKFFKPSDGLQSMYTWWFRQCARMLRLTWFMFDERRPDEEGHIVRRSWKSYLEPSKGNLIHRRVDEEDPFASGHQAYLMQDGRYVRAPASDQVRLPKGSRIFLEVDQNNRRLDGVVDSFDGVHGRNPEYYKLVYVPPWFRTRITFFIFSVWFFAAFTGVCITIVPLMFGRYVFAKVIPADVPKNDVYAFSIGIYILGSLLYAIVHLRSSMANIRSSLYINGDTPTKVFRRATKLISRLTRILWTYTAFLFVLPTLFAFLIEFYFIVPLHTYFVADEQHIVHFVQSWTLGLLYVKLTTRIILWHEGSRPAEALRAITRNGYLNPDARLATRSFILPAGLALSAALGIPYVLARLAAITVYRNLTEQEMVFVHRNAYPMVLGICITAIALWKALGVVRGWKQKIKDDVYLIGERLHNFGDHRKVVPGTGLGGNVVRRIDT